MKDITRYAREREKGGVLWEKKREGERSWRNTYVDAENEREKRGEKGFERNREKKK